MVVFNSIVAFDAETTSLPHFDYNTTKIVELAFIGCEVKHLMDSKKLPRALHKLVLLFNPNKLISPGATEVSGLDNELLANLKPFEKEDSDMLKHFISRLPSPVCIVAHNGDKFDFPILRRALSKLQTVFGNNVYCADSLKAFKEIYPKSSVKGLPTQGGANVIQPEKTPPNQKTVAVNQLHYKGSKFVKRELFPDHDKLDEWISNQSVHTYFSSPDSYKLRDIHVFLFGENFKDSHRAEADSLALLNCIVLCDKFLDYINSHAVIFDNTPPLF